MKLIFEKGREDRGTNPVGELDVPLESNALPPEFTRDDLDLPQLSEIEIIRHYTQLSRKNFGVDNGFYPLGSCTMKYNPKINEETARLSSFADSHPLQAHNQGSLQIIYHLEKSLCELTGMDAFTLQPAAGAHGELTALMMTRKYYSDLGEKRTKVITPDSSHGTNPATIANCGFDTVQIKSDARGQVDIEELKSVLGPDVAAIMLTIPNTLGIFEENILEITKLMHDNGSLVYMDGANMNALVGNVRPIDMGVDVLHINLHKTFSTPHGGGGPGAGPVGVCSKLTPYLPGPIVEMNDGTYVFKTPEKSIGKVRAFYGNFGILVRAYTYIRSLGREGLKRVSDMAVLNANYLKACLQNDFFVPYNSVCKHEFVMTDKDMPNHITTDDIAKRLLDYNIHPMTVYFPLIVPGAMMIEPTETESKETLDRFVTVMKTIKEEASQNPGIVKSAPTTTVVGRLDAVKAARQPDLKFSADKAEEDVDQNQQ